ncbi:unnamed protein product [Owenia fusiformis]|uniref:Uncharacterized protein n=1 Tax=Owenia fusiformis TaxID=6347 RepID=A0A8J1U765_OWEFU|nr:unnamed protein product [Owenia fusiformis]
MEEVDGYLRVKRFDDLVNVQTYLNAIERTNSYNARLQQERKMRMPFLDSQTGVAQNSTNLRMQYHQRAPGTRPGQLYSYPAKRWKKKKRAFEPSVMEKIMKAGDIEMADADMHQISAIENPAALRHEESQPEELVENAKIQWYDEFENISEPPDAGEIDEKGSDSSDYEELYAKKKKKRGGRPRGSKTKAKVDKDLYYEVDEKEKPYGCDICGARYKTKPGLTYHLTHAHTDNMEEDEDLYLPSPKPTPSSFDNAPEKEKPTEKYCDFCLGNEMKNEKTGGPEELVSCGDCGRSGHPTCLQFTANMIVSVKKYPWQCIECKSCGLCGTSDNDDQLLFCDDCDRGYHMYCLKPPLSEPPEGSWSCHLCIEEFHGGKKPNGQ